MTLVDDLLAGPRGRHLLLEVALALEGDDGPLFQATWRVGSYMEYHARKFGTPRTRSAQARARTVAPLLEQVPLKELTPPLIYDALDRTVHRATYWQPPLDDEVFLAAAPLRPGLRRLAGHLAASEVTAPWSEPFRPDRQTSVCWEKPDHPGPVPSVAEALEAWRQETQTSSGLWWSRPPWPLIATARDLVDGTPGGLRFVEDGFGWTTGRVHRAVVSADVRVVTIDGPEAWAQLCRRFPLDVTVSRGMDWQMATGYPHGWVMPDFGQVAQHYDALHLSLRSYVATAGRVIPVDDRQAGLLAGWDPGRTFWFTDAVDLEETPVIWRDVGDGDGLGAHDWRRPADG